MRTIDGLTIKEAAPLLNVGSKKLRAELTRMGAIYKLAGGSYVANPSWKSNGLLATETRRSTIRRHGRTKKHFYTVVIITGDGLAELQKRIEAKKCAG